MRTHEFKAVVRKVIGSKPIGYAYTEDPKTEETRKVKRLLGVKTNGDACFYRHHDGTPGCIVGHVVDAVQPGTVLTENKMPGQLVELGDIDAKLFTPLQLDQLRQMQRNQDNRRTWHEAYVLTFGRDKWASDRELWSAR